MNLYKVYNIKCMLPVSKPENKFQQSPPFFGGHKKDIFFLIWRFLGLLTTSYL